MAPTPRRRVADSPQREVAEPILADMENYAALDAVAQSEGGKVLMATFMSDAIDALDAVIGSYKKLTHAELQGYAATLSANIGALRALKRAGKNKADARATLEEVLGDATQ